MKIAKAFSDELQNEKFVASNVKVSGSRIYFTSCEQGAMLQAVVDNDKGIKSDLLDVMAVTEKDADGVFKIVWMLQHNHRYSSGPC